MFEKVNPSHPDKIADRIAGAIVDIAYTREHDPKIAVEVLIGHHVCNIIAETSVSIPESTVIRAVQRIADLQSFFGLSDRYLRGTRLHHKLYGSFGEAQTDQKYFSHPVQKCSTVETAGKTATVP